MLGIWPADGGTHRFYEVGIEHLAFEVDEREEIDEAYGRYLSTGADIHCPPEEDRDVDGYYAFFAFDPDAMRVEVFCWPRSKPLTQVTAPTSGAASKGGLPSLRRERRRASA